MEKAKKASASVFGDIAEKVGKMYPPKEAEKPKLEVSKLEYYSAWMSKCGYEMTAKTVEVLADYLRGYNLWLCGKVGVGKTYFFKCINLMRCGSGVR